MKRTRPAVLAILLLVGAAISYVPLHLLFANGHSLPRLPWTNVPLLLFLAALLLLTAYNINRRLEELSQKDKKTEPNKRKPMNPLFLARLVLLAKSAAHGGALLSGLYAGICVAYLVDLPHSNLIRNPILDTICALLVAIAGVVLERVLTIKDDNKAI